MKTTRYTIAGADGKIVISPTGGHPLRPQAGSAAAWASWSSVLRDYAPDFAERRRTLGEHIVQVTETAPDTPVRLSPVIDREGPYDDGTQRNAIED